MDFKTQAMSASGLAGVTADALLVVLVGKQLPKGLDSAIASTLRDAVAAGDLALEPGKSLYAHKVAGLKAGRLAAVCAADASPRALKKALGAGLGLIKGGGTKKLAVALAGADWTEALGEVLAAACAEAAYLYRHTKPSAPPAPKLTSVQVLCGKDESAAVEAGLARGRAIAEGVTLARELANRPGNHCTPTHLADEARRLGKAHGFKVEVLERRQMERLGMGALLAVSQGSEQPPKFIVIRYQGAGKADAPVVLVGKGITFDTGGISIKPAGGMDEMKFDMGGAASVLGTMQAVGELKPKLNIVGIVAACENMPDGRAIKPGDVVTSLSGQTIEILNTDAEGRLILCDALAWAERLKPAAIVDMATLTGACVIALGHHRSGLFSADDDLAAELLAAGEAGLDPACRLPLDDEYGEALKSSFADVANVGGREGGAITAAKFLQRFVGSMRWAHLDIAGAAWKSGAAKGATGRPVALLMHFLLARAR
jgi:leucyl aminopeptidase